MSVNTTHHKPSRDTEFRLTYGAEVLIAIMLAMGAANLIPVVLSILLTFPILAFVVVYLYVIHHYHPKHWVQMAASLFVFSWSLQTSITAWMFTTHHITF